MSDLSHVDPQLRDLAAAFPPMILSAETLAQSREAMAAMQLPYHGDTPTDVDRHEIWVAGKGDAPAIRTIIHGPTGTSGPMPVVLQIHGGGMVMGCPENNEQRSAFFAHHHQCLVVTPDYRKAPETAGPGAAEDCLAVLAWLHRGGDDSFGIQAGRIILFGESGGGGTAAGMCLMNRDSTAMPVAALMLFQPMLDDRTGAAAASAGPYGEFVWTAQANGFCWDAVRGGPSGDKVSPYIAPARAIDLSGLPPTFISVGQLDLFFRESLDFAAKLADAGVPVELRTYSRAFHGFTLAADADVAKRASRDIDSYLARAICGEV